VHQHLRPGPRCTAAGLPFVEIPISGTSATLAKGTTVGRVLAGQLGLDTERFLDVLIGSAAYSRVMETKGRMMATRQFEPLQSKVDQSLKDFRLILEQAASHGQALPFAVVYAELLEGCMALGEAMRENAVIVDAIARCRIPELPAHPA
jgi:hypothetical protein